MTVRASHDETPERLGWRCEHWDRARLVMEQRKLDAPAGGFRIGAYRFLNAAPLIRGIESEVVYGTPAELAAKMAAGELDAALLSIVEVLLKDRYDVLDGVGIASLGEVKSVLYLHRGPVEAAHVVYYDPASTGSMYLLRVLLAERGLRPEFRPLPVPLPEPLPDHVLLIGDTALDLLHRPHDYEVLDLGAAWFELTGLPFVYAVWALQRNRADLRLRDRLRAAWMIGRRELDAIIREDRRYTYAFRRDYLGWHLHFHVGSEEKRGIVRFKELLERHGLGPVFEPRFVD